MIALTASNTETWTMAIVLTVMGVAGILDAMSAALAFASVTTSARASGATTDSSIAARTPRYGLVFMVAPPWSLEHRARSASVSRR